MTATLDKLDGAEHATTAQPAKTAARRARLGLWRLLDWRVVMAGAVAGGIVHIAIVFSTPFSATGSAFQRLRGVLPVNRVHMIQPQVSANQVLPFVQPDALYAMCRFDLAVDSLRVVAVLPEPGWTLSLHSAQGDNFYAMAGQQKRTEVTFVVVPAGERSLDIGSAPRRLGGVDLQVASPTLEGIIVVRAPLKGLAYRQETEALLSGTACSTVKR